MPQPTARLNLSYTVITATADGVVVENPEGADVAVYDAGGREVYASRDGAEKQMVVLPSGVYVVKVGYKVMKVMK